MSKTKRQYIKDALWGEIEIFPWEKPLFSSSMLNRLHGITQNASAFRVYPSLKHTRFSHSVGVMHVAGEMCRNLYLNLGLKFEISKRGHEKVIDQSITQKKIGANSQVHISKFKDFALSHEDVEEFDKELIALWTSHSDPKEWLPPAPDAHNSFQLDRDFFDVISLQLPANYAQRYKLAYAVIRICGLIHDIGHLPYSHTSEAALKSYFYDTAKGTPDSVGADITQALDHQGLQLHELLGGLILDDFNSFHVRLSPNPFTRFLILLAKDVAFSPKYPILRSIISGPIDADRIDYVRRDSEMSGFQKSGVDYGRIFHSTTLVKFNDLEDDHPQLTSYHPKDPPLPLGSPSKIIITAGPRATSDIEKLLRERFQAYRHIYNHHKVRLFDLFMQRCVKHLASSGHFNWLIERLSTRLAPEKTAPDEAAPPVDPDIPYQSSEDREKDKAARAAERHDKAFFEHVRSLEIQMTDSWLEQQIKEIWDKALRITPPERRKLDEEERWLLWGLSSIIENRTWFKTGFRSPSEFWQRLGPEVTLPASFEEATSERERLPLATLASRTKLIELKFLRKDCFVIFGVQSGPESVGANPTFLQRFSLEERCSDLIRLTYQAPFVNFWFISKSEDREEHEKIRISIIDELRRLIKDIKLGRSSD
jgi:HD superfamily phosphohydrolase